MLCLLMESIINNVEFAPINTRAAKDTFNVFHSVLKDHAFDRETHGAVFGTGMAMFTLFGIGLQPERGPAEQVSNLPAQD